MSYVVWLFAPTYAFISTKLSLYFVSKALSLHNILMFSFHAYRTRQMSVNGGTKKVISVKGPDSWGVHFSLDFLPDISLFFVFFLLYPTLTCLRFGAWHREAYV